MELSKIIYPKGLANSFVMPEKNLHWLYETPNTKLERDSKYRTFCKDWKKRFRVSGTLKFAEMRIVKTKSSNIEWEQGWWEDSMFMDKLFWVYLKPTPVLVGDIPARVFYLEPYECMRVVANYITRDGYNKLESYSPALVLPEDVVSQAWNETSNGISDHIREHTIEPLTQEDQDRDGEFQEFKERVLSTARAVSEDWNEAADRMSKITKQND